MELVKLHQEMDASFSGKALRLSTPVMPRSMLHSFYSHPPSSLFFLTPRRLLIGSVMLLFINRSPSFSGSLSGLYGLSPDGVKAGALETGYWTDDRFLEPCPCHHFRRSLRRHPTNVNSFQTRPPMRSHTSDVLLSHKRESRDTFRSYAVLALFPTGQPLTTAPHRRPLYQSWFSCLEWGFWGIWSLAIQGCKSEA